MSPSFSGQFFSLSHPSHPHPSQLPRSFQVLAAQIPVPSIIPAIHREFNDYLAFDLNWSAIHAGLYILYYLALEPVAAVSLFMLKL